MIFHSPSPANSTRDALGHGPADAAAVAEERCDRPAAAAWRHRDPAAAMRLSRPGCAVEASRPGRTRRAGGRRSRRRRRRRAPGSCGRSSDRRASVSHRPSSASATSWPVRPLTRMAARSCALERSCRGRRSSIAQRVPLARQPDRARRPRRPGRAGASGRSRSTETPFRAAFSWSVTKTSFAGGGLDGVVHLDDARLLAQPVGDRAGRGDQVVVARGRAGRRPRRRRGEHRRAGRQLDDLDPRLVLLGDLRSGRRAAAGRCAWLCGLAVLLADEVDPDLGLVRHLPQVVVPHQAVEIDRAGDADVAGEVGDLRHLARYASRTPARPRSTARASSPRRSRGPAAARSCCRTAASSAAPTASPPGPSRRRSERR